VVLPLHEHVGSRLTVFLSQCVIALGDSTYGIIMLPIVLSFSRVLAAIATNLDRNPALVRNSDLHQTQESEGASGKVSFVEDAANVLREAFIKCLAGSPGVSRLTRPTSKDRRIGIYLTANSALKLFMRSRKLRNAQQIFISIDAQSPPLSYYPAAERVTYLYYLGRYHLANNHFLRAQRVLQSAYDECHRQFIGHKRLILIYLVASNICLGRFPSAAQLSRPEAVDVQQRFMPLCHIIRSGDLGLFHQYLDLNSESGRWFLHRSILLQLQNRCEILVWRSLIRRCFLLNGFKGEEKKVPFLRLNNVLCAARWTLNRQKVGDSLGALGSYHKEHVDPEFAGMDEAIRETGFDPETGLYHDEYIGHDVAEDDEPESPTMSEVESVVLSLIQQGLLGGFALHSNPRFAIPGSQAKGGPLKAGFPEVWSVVKTRDVESHIPGWVDEQSVGEDLR
jgi:nuclear mRNA export protein PCID2/THP1